MTAPQRGTIGPTGELGLRVIRPPGSRIYRPLRIRPLLHDAWPHNDLPAPVRAYRSANWTRFMWGLRKVAWARLGNCATLMGTLRLRVRSPGYTWKLNAGWLDLGLVSARLVTNAGVDFITDAFQNIVELELMKFHGIGLGTTAAAVGDTALETELTTQYDPDSTRATGSQAENGTNVYKTVGTNTVDASVAITEQGILTQAATGGGVLLDRHTFSVINLSSGGALESTYELTTASGG